MSVTTAAVPGLGRNTAGRRFEDSLRVTFDSSYVTGGKPLAALAFNLDRIRTARAQIVSGFSASFAHIDALVQTDGSLLLRLRAAAGTEVPNGTDASAVVADVIVEGY